MHHVAIMKKAWGLIPKILSGEKTIESRWYQTRRAPWNGIEKGDVVFFKNSGEKVTARATVSEMLQFVLEEKKDAEEIVKKYGDEICVVQRDVTAWGALPKYCILVRLQDPQAVEAPFTINKQGFGSAAAWLTVRDIRKIAC